MTGAPKLAQQTQANQLHAAWGAAQMYGASEHDVILNLACLACGSTDLDPAARSPKPVTLVPAGSLTRRRPGSWRP